MTLKPPFLITARLLPGVRVGHVFISIEYAGQTGDGRIRYRYHIDGPGWEHSGSDLKSGCGGGSLQGGMESLLSFLGAAAESWRYRGAEGENSDLFPAEVCEWAAQNSDELAMLQCEIEEAGELVCE